MVSFALGRPAVWASTADVCTSQFALSHKSPFVEDAIKAAGAELMFLPPYSPDFNPIEKAFSKLKALAAQGQRAHGRGAMERHRPLRRRLHTSGMRQLLRGGRL